MSDVLTLQGNRQVFSLVFILDFCLSTHCSVEVAVALDYSDTHTHTHTHGRTPLGPESARRRDQPAIPAGERTHRIVLSAAWSVKLRMAFVMPCSCVPVYVYVYISRIPVHALHFIFPFSEKEV